MSDPVYVVDTNVIVDYVNIIPNGTDIVLDDPTVDLSHAHVIIPSPVVRELSNFKKENTDRGIAAREALRRIRRLVENVGRTMKEVYALEKPIEVQHGARLFSVLPVDKDFTKDIPFLPSSADMDGQIILAAMTAAQKHPDVILLTNDNGLAIRAFERGVKTSRFGYQYPPPYTGRRDLKVPKELLQEFLTSRVITLELWQKLMPREPQLIANEFIVMQPTVDNFYDLDDGHFRYIGRYDALSRKIIPLRYLDQYPLAVKNAGQAIYVEALMDPNIAAVISTGPAGSGKTFIAAVYGYTACKRGDYIGVMVVPCNVENGIGFLPGDINEKLDPNVQPIKNALRNFLIQSDKDIRKLLDKQRKFGTENDAPAKDKEPVPVEKSVKKRLIDQVNLIWENWFDNIPIAVARGRDFTLELAIYDEFQDQNRGEADTLIKRLGREGKIVITGDIEQIHAAYLDRDNNGLVYARQQLMDHPMVAQVTFLEEEVVRHTLVKDLTIRQRAARQKHQITS
jgi:predicted ribonuclease YlaK